jgi:hypothetical protein
MRRFYRIGILILLVLARSVFGREIVSNPFLNRAFVLLGSTSQGKESAWAKEARLSS